VTAIRLSFPGGSYHATPWGRNVNEGVTEWPPSPYRLLRALYDVWQRKCAGLPAEDVRVVLENLGSAPPLFRLPRATATHTRSYLSANKEDPSEKNLVFDGFLVFGRQRESGAQECCYVVWPELELPARATQALKVLLENLNYLGRSESWVKAELWDGGVEPPFDAFAADIPVAGYEQERVACAVSPGEYKGKQAWMEALTFSTAQLLKERASSPPLLRQVPYAVSKNLVTTNPPRRLPRKQPTAQAVLVSLDGPVLPLVTTTIEVAEQVRTRLMGAHKRTMNGDETKVSPLFSGKNLDGSKRLDHGHVYILPLKHDGGNSRRVNRIDRVLLISPLSAFTRDELEAIRGVRELWQGGGRPNISCVLTWQGGLDDTVVRTPARVVQSATPFVPPRHWRKGRDFQQFMEDEVRRECRNHRVGGRPSEVEVLRHMPEMFEVVEYRRNRKDDPVRPAYALRLTFADPVLAPFAIGYAAHFGLGQFLAAEGV
jgi:CRISPR-associated protein Csb2